MNNIQTLTCICIGYYCITQGSVSLWNLYWSVRGHLEYRRELKKRDERIKKEVEIALDPLIQ